MSRCIARGYSCYLIQSGTTYGHFLSTNHFKAQTTKSRSEVFYSLKGHDFGVGLFLEVISKLNLISLCQHVDVNSRCRDFKALVQRKVSGQKQRAVQSPEYSKIYGEVIDRYFVNAHLFKVSYKLCGMGDWRIISFVIRGSIVFLSLRPIYPQ